MIIEFSTNRSDRYSIKTYNISNYNIIITKSTIIRPPGKCFISSFGDGKTIHYYSQDNIYLKTRKGLTNE